jgi:hypothetical protein
MDSQKNITINALVWAVDLTKAQEIARKFTNGTSENEMLFIRTASEYTLRTFVRSPNTVPTQSPGGIADIIIIYLSSNDTSELQEAKKYVDTRQGIPIKVLCSESALLDEAAALDSKYVNVSEVTGDGSETILKEARKFEETLVNCFNKFDINGNGLISVDELIKVSEELGHILELDDAKMIAESLDESKILSGNISFEGFKKWWVMGKRDFHTFRRICKAEMSINNLIKLTSNKFNSYLENLKANSAQVSQEELLQGIDINLHSKQSFENGIGLFLELCSGAEAKEAISSFPESVRNSPAAFSLRLGFSDADSAKGVCDFLSQIAGSMLDENPMFKPYLDIGLQYAFRTSGSFLVVDISLNSLAADIIVESAQQFDSFQNVDISGNLTFHLFSKLTINHILSEVTIFDVIEKLLYMKLHLNSKYFGLRQLWGQISEQLKSNIDSNPSIRTVAMLVETMLALKCFKLDFGFDAMEAKNLIVEVNSIEKCSMYNDSVQETKAILLSGKSDEEDGLVRLRSLYMTSKEQVEGMKGMIPEEFMPIIKSVNLEKVEFETFVNLSNRIVFFKTTFNLSGLNGIRDEVFA